MEITSQERIIQVLMECAVFCGRITSSAAYKSEYERKKIMAASNLCASCCLEAVRTLKENNSALRLRDVLNSINSLRADLIISMYGVNEQRAALTSYEKRIEGFLSTETGAVI